MPFLNNLNVQRPWPKNIRNEDRHIFNHERERTFSPWQEELLNNVDLHPNGWAFEHGKALQCPKAVARSMSPRILQTRARQWFYRHLQKKRHYDETLWVMNPWSGGIYHWFCDVVPKLLCFEQKWGSILTLIPTHFPHRDLITDSLQALGCQNWQWLDHTVSAEYCHVISGGPPTGNTSPEDTQSCRKRFLNAMGLDPHQLGRQRVFISRWRSKRRKISNESELYPLLKSYGFEILHLEDLSFREQVTQLHSANIIMGGHGAGLVNMMWMHPQSQVMELRRQDDHHSLCFYALAHACDHRYHYHLTQAVDRHSSHHKGDLWVDPKSLATTLQGWLGSP